jgi:hypothetical protein
VARSFFGTSMFRLELWPLELYVKGYPDNQINVENVTSAPKMNSEQIVKAASKRVSGK